MEQRVENIIECIEDSFNKLNTSVELLKKAENIASLSAETTNQLINEFQATISSIEKLVKVDFANEYNRVVSVNNQLFEKLDSVDFENKFNDVLTSVSNKNFDTDFHSIKASITQKQEVLAQQLNKQSAEIENVNVKIDNKNFDSDFHLITNSIKHNQEVLEQQLNKQGTEIESVKVKIDNKNFDRAFSSIKTEIKEKNFNADFSRVIKKMEAAKLSIDEFQSENQELLIQRLDQQDKKLKLLKTFFFILSGLIIIGTISAIFILK